MIIVRYIEQILTKKVIFETLLQIGAAFVITNRGNSHYNLGQLILLQIGKVYFKLDRGRYYKSRQLLQIGAEQYEHSAQFMLLWIAVNITVKI